VAHVFAGEPQLSQRPATMTSDPRLPVTPEPSLPVTSNPRPTLTPNDRLRRSAVQMALGGLVLLVLFVMMSRASTRGTGSANTGSEEASEAFEPAAAPTSARPAGAAGDSASQAVGGTAAGSVQRPDPRDGATRADGCFRSGSSNTEVRAVMGAPDSVFFGEWRYGQSSVSFGYGVVLDYENLSDNLKLC
jgi:hypothetical protein